MWIEYSWWAGIAYVACVAGIACADNKGIDSFIICIQSRKVSFYLEKINKIPVRKKPLANAILASQNTATTIISTIIIYYLDLLKVS